MRETNYRVNDMQKIIISITLTLVFWVAITRPVLSEEVRDRTLSNDTSRYFDLIFSSTEYHGKIRYPNWQIDKWGEPIKIYIDGQRIDINRYRRFLFLQMKEIEKIAQITIQFVVFKKDANFIFEIGKKITHPSNLFPPPPKNLPIEIRNILKRAKRTDSYKHQSDYAKNNPTCFTHVLDFDYPPNGPRKITKFIARIDLSNSEKIVKNCLLRQLVQGLGFFGNNDLIPKSIFNKKLILLRITKLDKQLIRLLYSKSMLIGTKRKKAIQLIKTLANSIKN